MSRSRAADDAEFISKRIEELRKEREQTEPKETNEYPNAPIGHCFPCQVNKTTCDGSCSWG